MPGDIELSGLEVSLVNVMSREIMLRSYVERVKDGYDYSKLFSLTFDALPALLPIAKHLLCQGLVRPGNCLQYLQEQGLMASAPIGCNDTGIERVLTTKSTAILPQVTIPGTSTPYLPILSVVSSIFSSSRTRNGCPLNVCKSASFAWIICSQAR